MTTKRQLLGLVIALGSVDRTKRELPVQRPRGVPLGVHTVQITDVSVGPSFVRSSMIVVGGGEHNGAMLDVYMRCARGEV